MKRPSIAAALLIAMCGAALVLSNNRTARAAEPVTAPLADALYRSLAQGEPAQPAVKAIFDFLGFRLIPANSTDTVIRTALQGREPVIFAGQDQFTARLFAEGKYLNLNDFLRLASTKGFTRAGSSQPLTAAYLASKLTYVERKATLVNADLLPSLLVELAKARAKWLRTTQSMPFWRDGLLDPLQYLILQFALMHEAAPTPPSPSPVANPAVGPQLALDDAFVTFDAAADSSGAWRPTVGEETCVSFIMDRIVQTTTVQPGEIWHRQPENPALPFRSNVAVQLVRIAEPSGLGARVEAIAACRLPALGGLRDRPTTFGYQSAGARTHGTLDPEQTRTDASGLARAVYTAVDESVPPPERTPDRLRRARVFLFSGIRNVFPPFPGLGLVIRGIPIEVNYYVRDPAGAPAEGDWFWNGTATYSATFSGGFENVVTGVTMAGVANGRIGIDMTARQGTTTYTSSVDETYRFTITSTQGCLFTEIRSWGRYFGSGTTQGLAWPGTLTAVATGTPGRYLVSAMPSPINGRATSTGEKVMIGPDCVPPINTWDGFPSSDQPGWLPLPPFSTLATANGDRITQTLSWTEDASSYGGFPGTRRVTLSLNLALEPAR